MATWSLRRQRILFNKPGNHGRFQEAATQSFKIGDLVALDGSNQLVLLATDATAILGMAREDASGTQATYLEVETFDLDTRLAMTVYHATPASAVTAISQINVAYEAYGSGRKVHVDIAASSNKIFIIRQIAANSYRQGQEAVGDQWGEVDVSIDASALQGAAIDS